MEDVLSLSEKKILDAKSVHFLGVSDLERWDFSPYNLFSKYGHPNRTLTKASAKNHSVSIGENNWLP